MSQQIQKERLVLTVFNESDSERRSNELVRRHLGYRNQFGVRQMVCGLRTGECWTGYKTKTRTGYKTRNTNKTLELCFKKLS